VVHYRAEFELLGSLLLGFLEEDEVELVGFLSNSGFLDSWSKSRHPSSSEDTAISANKWKAQVIYIYYKDLAEVYGRHRRATYASSQYYDDLRYFGCWTFWRSKRQV